MPGGSSKTPDWGAGGGTDGGFLGQCKDLGFGRIFKDEKPLEHFEQMTHSYSLAHDSLSRRVCMGGREGAGGPERQLSQLSRHKVMVLGPDWKWWQQREMVCF